MTTDLTVRRGRGGLAWRRLDESCATMNAFRRRSPATGRCWRSRLSPPRPARRGGARRVRLRRRARAGAALLAAAVAALAGRGAPTRLTLPIGLPWLGAHFRLDALSAFFARVIDLGGAAASLYAPRLRPPRARAAAGAAVLSRLSRRHEARSARRRRLHVPDDVGAHVARVLGAGDGASREAENARAGFVYIVMASFGTLALLLAFGLLAGAGGGYAFDAMRAAPPSRRRRGAGAAPGADRRRLEGGPRAAARLAAARPSRRAEPCLGADERRDDQGRGLRLRPHRLRSRRPAGLAVERAGARARRGDRAASACCTR